MASQQQQPPQGDNPMDFFWLVAIVVVSLVAIWHFQSAPITRFVFNVRSFEIRCIEFFLDRWIAFTAWADHILNGLPAWAQFTVPSTVALDDWKQFMAQSAPGSVTFETLEHLSQAVGYYLRYPVMAFAIVMGGWLYFFRSGSRFSETLTMETLRAHENECWPHISPITRLSKDIAKVDITEGPWSMSLTPMGFAKKHGLLEDTRKNHRPAVKLVPGEAARVLSMQLGPLWKGPAALPVHVQALFAIFAAKGNNDTESANKLLAQISGSSRGGGKGLDFSGTMKLLIKHVRSRAVGRAVARHAYVLTAMASMLELARTDGVLGTAEFIWLKDVDRRLWYMLNNVGRQTAFPEVAGAIAHHKMEIKLGRPLKVPMVNEAVIALDEAIESIEYDPHEDYS